MIVPGDEPIIVAVATLATYTTGKLIVETVKTRKWLAEQARDPRRK